MAKTIPLRDRPDLGRAVVQGFRKWWEHKCPVPLSTMDLYKAAWKGQEWEAMHLLAENKPSVLAKSKTFEFYWTDDHTGTGDCPHAVFRFPKPHELPRHDVCIEMLPEREQRLMRHWVTNVQYFRSLEKEVKQRCDGLMGNPTGPYGQYLNRTTKSLDPRCNTPTQVYRIWPECQPLMPGDQKRTIQLASVKSPMPRRIGYVVNRRGREVWATPEQFRAEDPEATEIEKKRFREINHIILMASMADNIPHIEGYPSFFGPVV